MFLYSSSLSQRFYLFIFLSKANRSVPLVSCLGSGRPAAAVFGDDVDVGVVSLVLRLQAGQVSWGGHAPADRNFTQTLEAMSGSHWREHFRHKKVSISEAFIRFSENKRKVDTGLLGRK